MVPEHICEVRGGGRDYVIRAQPKGLPRGIAGVSVWVVLLAELRRWVRRERAWEVQVWLRPDDPFGRVLHEEEAADGREARERVEILGRELRAGNAPWSDVGPLPPPQ